MPEANTSSPTADETTTGRGSGPVNDAEESGAASSGAASPGEQPESTAAQRGAPQQDAPEEPAEAAGRMEEQESSPEAEPGLRTGLTPRQARRVRIIVSGVVMAAVAVALVVRLGSAPSVLTVGFYGIALILSGTAIGLSRRGRTRVATGVLVLGFGAVALAEWLLASAE